MLNEQSIADRLTAMGFKSTVSFTWDEMADGEVAIEGTDHHVQVGDGYVCLCRDNRSTPNESYWTRVIMTWTSTSKFLAEVGSFLSTTR